MKQNRLNHLEFLIHFKILWKNIYSSLCCYLNNLFEYIEYIDMKQNRLNHLQFFSWFYGRICTLRNVYILFEYIEYIDMKQNRLNHLKSLIHFKFYEEYLLFIAFLSL